jgi:hypothetical protein
VSLFLFIYFSAPSVKQKTDRRIITQSNSAKKNLFPLVVMGLTTIEKFGNFDLDGNCWQAGCGGCSEVLTLVFHANGTAKAAVKFLKKWKCWS